MAHEPSTQYNSVHRQPVGTDPTGNNAPAYAANGYWGVHLEGMGDCGTTPCKPDQNHETVAYNVIVGNGRGGVMVDKGTNNSLDRLQQDRRHRERHRGRQQAVRREHQRRRVQDHGRGQRDREQRHRRRRSSPTWCSTRTTSYTTTNQNTITQNSIHDNGHRHHGAARDRPCTVRHGEHGDERNTLVNDCMQPPTLDERARRRASRPRRARAAWSSCSSPTVRPACRARARRISPARPPTRPARRPSRSRPRSAWW